ncbi:MAG: FUSC family protein [Clostridiales bacterium]|jgi:uncharacterized membrane protein YgaE (UPF0421/DUF939 family)|nr:FUSC family protein [Clostridiales bacterium]
MKPPPKIGMRIIKTALAILATLIFTDIVARSVFRHYFREEYLAVTISVTATVMTMQDGVKTTIWTARNRVLSTILGATIGTLLMLLLMLFSSEEQQTLQRYLFYFTASLGSVLVIYVCKLIKYTTLSGLGVLVFISVLYGYNSADPMILIGVRVMETLIGVTTAVIVNLTIFPPKAQNQVCVKTEQDGKIEINCVYKCNLCNKDILKGEYCEECELKHNLNIGKKMLQSDVDNSIKKNE